MLQNLLPSLRNLRSSLLTGAILAGSGYVLFAYSLMKAISIHPAAQQILGLAKFMPQLVLATFCYLVGSLYVTGLEGIVDWVHRKTALKDFSMLKRGPKRWILRALSPLSDSARQRILVEANRFYGEVANDDENRPGFEANRQRFTEKVVTEILWMEGKLAGTPYLTPYEQYRSEGELQLGTAVLLPLVAAAVSYSLGANKYGILITTLISVPLAIKLGDYGLYYFRRAHSFLAHHVSDGTILAPSMEALKRANPKVTEPLPTVHVVPWMLSLAEPTASPPPASDSPNS